MVFSSLEFIYLFLPPTLLVFLVLRYFAWERGIIIWLIIASALFYAWWSISYLLLLLASVIINYALHSLLLNRRSKIILGLGVGANLITLAYFKYADFFIENINVLISAQLPLLDVILPLAISFFTFQQISFLFDTYRQKVSQCDFAKYCLFVTFFPQLIAGPIVLQKHTIPQFKLAVFQNHLFLNLAVGGALFAVGLFKKIVLADSMAPIANEVFNLAQDGYAVPMQAAWLGTVSYTMQIYFDFSGYCDMALGLARMFAIKLPVNFNSPYQALSIVDFWRRWHITLSAFLRDYLYIPLGGSRYGKTRQYLALMLTMLLGGLWHGASWTFVFWGFLHGFYLAVNHTWSVLTENITVFPKFLTDLVSRIITLMAVMISWVFFRAESFDAAVLVLQGMFGFTRFYAFNSWTELLAESNVIWAQCLLLTFIVLFLPNSMQWLQHYRPVLESKKLIIKNKGLAEIFRNLFVWRPTVIWSSSLFFLISTSLLYLYQNNNLTEFIYFNF